MKKYLTFVLVLFAFTFFVEGKEETIYFTYNNPGEPIKAVFS